MQDMKQIFDCLDTYNDSIVNRKAFIEKLRNNIKIAKVLHLPAVYLPSIRKTLILNK